MQVDSIYPLGDRMNLDWPSYGLYGYKFLLRSISILISFRLTHLNVDQIINKNNAQGS